MDGTALRAAHRRPHYSAAAAHAVHAAFDQLRLAGRVITPLDISRETGLGSKTVCSVLGAADYWTPEHRLVARREAAQRARAARAALPVAWRVEEAFCAIAARGEVPLPSDIATRAGLGVSTVRHILQRSGLWTAAHVAAARREAVRRSHVQQAADDWASLARAREAQQAQRAGSQPPGQDAAPRVGEARMAATSETYPGLRKAQQHARISNALTGQPGLQRARAANAASGYFNARVATCLRQTGTPLPPTHGIVVIGMLNRLQVLEALRTYWSAAGRHSRPSYAYLARSTGLSRTTVARHARRLAEDGLVDAELRPVELAVAPGTGTRDRKEGEESAAT